MALYDSILIVGGKGMLATALARLIRSRGHNPAVADLPDLDITDPASVRAVFQKHSPTLVLNCAAHTNVDLCEKQQERADAINGHAVGTLAAHCKEAGATLVHYSTDFVFDGTARQPYTADQTPRPLSAYGRSKLLGEQAIAANPPDRWLILRTSWLYGMNGNSFPRTMVTLARQGKPLKVVANQTGSPTLTTDLAQATLDLLDHNATGIYHVSNSGETTWFDFTAAILEEFGLKTELTSTTSEDWFKIRPESAARPAYSVMDTTPLARLLGRPMRSWREALHDFRMQVDAAGGTWGEPGNRSASS